MNYNLKESINANSILSKVEAIVSKTKIKHPKAKIIELDGTKYIYYSYFDRGFDDDGLDMVWDKCSDLKGVVDVGFGYGYGLENTKYEDSLLIELDDDVIIESKKSVRKSIEESKNMTFSFKESELFVDIKHIIDSEKINLHKKISTDFVYNLNEFKDICDELCKTENLYYIVYENKTSFKGDYNLVFFDIDDVDMRRNGEITFTVISDYNKEVIKFFNE